MNCSCGKPVHDGWRICRDCGAELWRLQDLYDAQKKRCAKTLAHQNGGRCLICGYDILPVGTMQPKASA